MTISVIAADEQRHRLNSPFFPLWNVDRLRFVTTALDPALIHAQQHVRPIARFRPACAGVNGEKGVRAIVFPGKELTELELLEFVHEPFVLRDNIALGLSTMSVVFFLGRELLQDLEVIDLALELAKWIDQGTQTRDFLDVGLGAFAIVPKIRAAHARFERGYTFLQLGQVKETSAARARAISNLPHQWWRARQPYEKLTVVAAFVSNAETKGQALGTSASTTTWV